MNTIYNSIVYPWKCAVSHLQAVPSAAPIHKVGHFFLFLTEFFCPGLNYIVAGIDQYFWQNKKVEVVSKKSATPLAGTAQRVNTAAVKPQICHLPTPKQASSRSIIVQPQPTTPPVTQQQSNNWQLSPKTMLGIAAGVAAATGLAFWYLRSRTADTSANLLMNAGNAAFSTMSQQGKIPQLPIISPDVPPSFAFTRNIPPQLLGQASGATFDPYETSLIPNSGFFESAKRVLPGIGKLGYFIFACGSAAVGIKKTQAARVSQAERQHGAQQAPSADQPRREASQAQESPKNAGGVVPSPSPLYPVVRSYLINAKPALEGHPKLSSLINRQIRQLVTNWQRWLGIASTIQLSDERVVRRLEWAQQVTAETLTPESLGISSDRISDTSRHRHMIEEEGDEELEPAIGSPMVQAQQMEMNGAYQAALVIYREQARHWNVDALVYLAQIYFRDDLLAKFDPEYLDVSKEEKRKERIVKCCTLALQAIEKHNKNQPKLEHLYHATYHKLNKVLDLYQGDTATRTFNKALALEQSGHEDQLPGALEGYLKAANMNNFQAKIAILESCAAENADQFFVGQQDPYLKNKLVRRWARSALNDIARNPASFEDAAEKVKFIKEQLAQVEQAEQGMGRDLKFANENFEHAMKVFHLAHNNFPKPNEHKKPYIAFRQFMEALEYFYLARAFGKKDAFKYIINCWVMIYSINVKSPQKFDYALYEDPISNLIQLITQLPHSDLIADSFSDDLTQINLAMQCFQQVHTDYEGFAIEQGKLKNVMNKLKRVQKDLTQQKTEIEQKVSVAAEATPQRSSALHPSQQQKDVENTVQEIEKSVWGTLTTIRPLPDALKDTEELINTLVQNGQKSLAIHTIERLMVRINNSKRIFPDDPKMLQENTPKLTKQKLIKKIAELSQRRAELLKQVKADTERETKIAAQRSLS